jgi:hypothetical protein
MRRSSRSCIGMVFPVSDSIRDGMSSRGVCAIGVLSGDLCYPTLSLAFLRFRVFKLHPTRAPHPSGKLGLAIA